MYFQFLFPDEEYEYSSVSKQPNVKTTSNISGKKKSCTITLATYLLPKLKKKKNVILIKLLQKSSTRRKH